MQESKVNTLVSSFSVAIFGEPQYPSIDENHPASSTNFYGRTMLHIEQMLEDLVASDPSWDNICSRYFNPDGANDLALTRESPSGILYP